MLHFGLITRCVWLSTICYEYRFEVVNYKWQLTTWINCRKVMCVANLRCISEWSSLCDVWYACCVFFFPPQLFWLRTFTRLLDSQKILLNITAHHSICTTDKFVSVILVSIFPGGEKNKTHVTAFPKWRLFCQIEANIELPEFQWRHEVVFNIFGFSSIMLLGTARCLSLSRYYTTQ